MVKAILKDSSGFSKTFSITRVGFGLLSLVIFVAVLIAGQNSFRHSLITANYRAIIESSNLTVRNFQASTSQDLIETFEAEGYVWPPTAQQTIPPLILAKLPADFANMKDHRVRQDLFLRALLPIVLIENRSIRERRNLAKLLLEVERPEQGSDMHNWLKNLAKQFRVHGDLKDPEVIARLLSRLDEIPPALALSQSAIETGWGTSRFALEGNSLFGQWTFKRSRGLKPSNRNADATHYVASFPTLRDSVRAYIRNLNVGHAYNEFRQARAGLRAEGISLQSEELAVYLYRYSQRGEKYVADLQRMIKSRHIAFLANTNLDPEEPKLFVASLGTNP
jgi:Bax protein